MIPPDFLHCLCFPWVLVSSDGRIIDQADGTLFKADKLSSENIEHCIKAPLGWSKDAKGYAVYTIVLTALHNAKLVLYGLKVSEVSTVSGKSEHLSIRTEKQDIERYIQSVFLGFGKIESYIAGLISRSVHEVRGINKDAKSAVEEILHELDQPSPSIQLVTTRINNIKALAEILTARTDFLDYFVNPAVAQIPVRSIRVYDKFFKTVKSLRKRALDKHIRLDIYGSSNGLISGFMVFEVAPFVLIENAIKYSPTHKNVDVVLTESLTEIQVIVRNVGPKVDEDEIPRLFELHVRSKIAQSSGIPGYGIGLFFLKELVEKYHRGKIEFRQIGPEELINGSPYKSTELVLRFERTG